MLSITPASELVPGDIVEVAGAKPSLLTI